MARYVDTATGNPADSLGTWLEENLKLGIRAFYAQTAWFSYGALQPFAGVLTDAAEAGMPIRFVLGSNRGSLSKIDAERTWKLLRNGEKAELVVVRYANATFHPKAFVIERADTSKTAVVGSANLTAPGLERNVEAGVVFDTADNDDPHVLARIVAAIDRWFDIDEAGVFPVASASDIDKLTEERIIDIPQPPMTIQSASQAGNASGHAGSSQSLLGFRPRVWKPPATQASQPTGATSVAAGGPQTAPAGPPVERWAKQLASSDAQQVGGRTNPTGKLRLTKSSFEIDHLSYFREVLFAGETWSTEVRAHGKTYEVAMVDFDVTFGGVHRNCHTLMIDYALHRVANQANVPTVLGWGHELGRYLARNSRIGDWVTIERLGIGNYRLTIQSDRPDWA